jgi:(methylthio)acryloyl-CoA hydratase
MPPAAPAVCHARHRAHLTRRRNQRESAVMSVSSHPALPPSVRIKRSGSVAVVCLSRPEKRNALNDETVLGLETAFTGIAEDIRAVVLHGEGDHFSAGLDLSELTERDVAGGVAHSRMWHRMLDTVQFGRAPVISVLHGAVVGGGLELACATHIRIAERSAYYALPEGMRGIFVGGGASVRLPRLIGVARMMDMMLTGRTYGAEEGGGLGFSQYLVEPGQGLTKALEIAERVAGNAGLTNFAVMHALPRIAEADPAAGFMMEALMSAIAQGSPEAKARLNDFLEKRGAKTLHAQD